jgi:hypothetical protein
MASRVALQLENGADSTPQASWRKLYTATVSWLTMGGLR